jgi:non-ribosomal peptide synthetase component F
MLTMSAYAVMLAAAHDSPSVVLGMPVRGRLSPELEGVMGYFINLLPMPFEIDPSQSIGQLVGKLRGEMIEAMDNQEIPFVRLVSDSSMSARARNGGLYQALFSFQDSRERKREWGGLKHEGIPIFQKGASEDLGVWLMEVPNGLEGGITYNADLYHHETAVALRNRYLAVLRRIAADPAVSLSALMAEATASATAPHAPAAPAAEAAPAPAANGLASEHERKLAAIWANVLGIDVGSITARDNFFDLGGHSLLAMRAVEDAGRAFGFRIDARRYFYETLGQLANPEAAKQAASVAAVAAAAPAATQGDAPRGLLSRLFGRKK